MDLERQTSLISKILKPCPAFVAGLTLLLSFWMLQDTLKAQSSGKPTIIRDTGIAEGKESTEEAKPKEPNPLLAEENLNIGNFYYKKKNYPAAIQRYLEALEYKPNFIRAYEALAEAYEKNNEPDKAVDTYKDFLKKYPDSPKCSDFRAKLEKLDKKTK
jgi:tetratricopeptide (TPR) repeat protein